jgi:hypothetical protein
MSLTPWHERRSTLEEERQFKKLITLHSLTHQWTQAMSGGNEEASVLRIERMPKITLRQNLWLLEKARLDEVLTELNTLVGEQKVSDFIAELYETIWLIQSSTLENAFSETKDPSLLMNLLKNAAWTHGKKTAEQEWSKLESPDLHSAYHAFLETHVDSEKGFLLGRSSEHELGFYWIRSPYQNAALNTSPQIETLCSLHQEWIQGFFYGLSRKIKVSSTPATIDGNQWIDFTLLLTY